MKYMLASRYPYAFPSLDVWTQAGHYITFHPSIPEPMRRPADLMIVIDVLASVRPQLEDNIEQI